MPTLTTRDYRTIQRGLVTTIVDIMDKNHGAKLEHICNALQDEVNNLRALREEYLNQLKDSTEVMNASLIAKIDSTITNISDLKPSPNLNKNTPRTYKSAYNKT